MGLLTNIIFDINNISIIGSTIGVIVIINVVIWVALLVQRYLSSAASFAFVCFSSRQGAP